MRWRSCPGCLEAREEERKRWSRQAWWHGRQGTAAVVEAGVLEAAAVEAAGVEAVVVETAVVVEAAAVVGAVIVWWRD